MEIRELTAEDFYILADIMSDIAEEAADVIKPDQNEQQTGIKVFVIAAKRVPHKIREFLAAVTDMDLEKHNKLPFVAPLRIARELMKRQEIKDFLQEAKQLMQEIRNNK